MGEEFVGYTSLKEYLEASNLTDGELAALIPCTRSYITNIANGKQTPGYKMAARIEAVTYGLVPKTIWFPEKEEVKE